jgi:hypothetical protein
LASVSRPGLRAKLDELNCDPIELLATLAKGAAKEETQFNAAKELAQYIAPKLKAVDMSVKGDHSITITVTSYAEMD